ncbi:MAG: MFS transporter [Rhodospirillaceae bacterium]|nr:MFS transporter [Rhodospirillaceae bacterium]
MTPPRPSPVPISAVQLSASSALSPFALVIVSPLLPELGRLYSAPAAEVQYVISAYLIGLCIAQLILGALSDRFGRRVVLLTALVVYVVMSAACALATSIETLILARFLQACGAAGSAAVCRAVVHDVYHGDRAVTVMSYIASAHSIAHMFAPVVGGALGQSAGVAGVFGLLCVLGLVMLVFTYTHMPETRVFLPGPAKFSVWHMLANNWHVAKSPVFLCYAGLFGLTGAPFFAFLAVGPGYFAEHFGTSAAAFGLYWSVMSVMFFLGSAVAPRLVRRLGRAGLLRLIITLGTLLAAVWPIAMQVLEPTAVTLITPPAVLSGLLGMITGVVLSGAIGAVPHLAGTASGLCGALAMASAAVFTILTGVFYTGSAMGMVWPTTVALFIMAILTAILAVIEKPAESKP